MQARSGGIVAEEKGLSDRERQILRLVATGASNKEIARHLVISTNTVKVHLRNIFVKIDVMSRTEATLYAIREGLVQVGETRPSPASLAGDEGGPEEEPAAPVSPEPVVLHPWWRRLGVWQLAGAVGLVVVLLLAAAAAGAVALGPLVATATPTLPAPSDITPVAATAPSRWRLRASMQTARSGLGAAVYDGRIYAIAGDGRGGPTGANERYDPITDVWEIVGSKPVPVADVSAAVVGGRIYVPGGRLASGAVTSTVEVYDPVRNAWEQRAPLPVALSAYAMVAFEGRLYVFGGWDGFAYRADTLEYDPGRDLWTARTPMPTARGSAGAALAGGKLYVVGGTSDGATGLSVNEEYVPSREGTGAWVAGSPLAQGRRDAGVAVLADVVYLVGGMSDPESAAEPLQYSVHSEASQVFENPVDASWTRPGLVSMGDFLYSVGGRVDGLPSAEMRSYQAVFTILIPSVR